jgi:TonB-like protein
MSRTVIAAVAFLVTTVALPAAVFLPARWNAGSLPPLPPSNTVGWIEHLFELQVDAAGRVQSVEWLQRTPAPDDTVTPVLSQWQFKPAELDGGAVPSRVLVSTVFRPPVLHNNPTAGNAPGPLAQASAEVPVPIGGPNPAYPALAVSDVVVMLEVRVAADGRVTEVHAMAGPAPFARASIDAVRQWAFRPASRAGRAIDAYAYVIFGFRRPLTS